MNIQKIMTGLEKTGVKMVDDAKFQRYSRYLQNNNKDELLESIVKDVQFIKDFIASSNAIATMNKAALHINK